MATLHARSRNVQLHLGSCIGSAPDGQLPAGELGALPHPVQAKVPFPSLRAQHLRVDALAVVAHAQTDLPFVVPKLHFDLLRTSTRNDA